MLNKHFSFFFQIPQLYESNLNLKNQDQTLFKSNLKSTLKYKFLYKDMHIKN